MIRKLLFQIHLWTGLILFLPLITLGLSGSALVAFEALDHARPAHVAASGAPHSFDEIAAAALAAAPAGARVTAFNAPQGADEAAQVRVGARGASLLDVDPYTLQVLRNDRTAGRNSAFRLAHDLHGRLLIEGPAGRRVVGWLGVAMCALGLSGVVLWWPRGGRWARAFTVAANKGAFRFNRDLHGAMGIWTLVVFLAVSFTGVAIAFPEPITNAIIAFAPGRDLRATQTLAAGPPGKPIGLDAIAALAETAAPDARLLAIAPPARPGQPARVMLARPGHEKNAPALNVLIDPVRARAIDVRDPRRYTLGENLQAWQRPLHEGAGLGPIWSVLVFLSGLTPLIFALTGVSMWLLKRRARAAMLEPGVELERI